MNYKLDPELEPAMAALAAQAAGEPRPARGDWQAVRAAASTSLAYMASIAPSASGVRTTSFNTPARDGNGEVGLRWIPAIGRTWMLIGGVGSIRLAPAGDRATQYCLERPGCHVG